MFLKKFHCGVLVFCMLGLITACNKSSFNGNNSAKRSVKSKGGDAKSGSANGADGANSDDSLSGSDGSGFKAKGLLAKDIEPYQYNNFWIVTMAGKIYYYEVEGDKLLVTKQWSFTNPVRGGARTYVTEGGLVFAKAGGHLYWIHPDLTPEGKIDESVNSLNYYHMPGIVDRMCIVSYRKNNKRYLGMGYDKGKFTEMAMENAPPYKPLFRQVTATGTHAQGGQWGYSCNIDQTNLRYYGAYVSAEAYALDLNTMTASTFDKAPNQLFKSATLPKATHGTSVGGSYALSGDRDGNFYSGAGFYTFAHEPKSNTVWATSGGLLYIMPRDCLTKTPNCVGHAALSMSKDIGANVGPLSALDNGYVVGAVRGVGQIYVMKLNDINDATKGITATRIATVEGDPYMYTDFTGATLYATETNVTYDLSTSENYILNKNLGDLQAVWETKTNVTTWSNLGLEARCYTDANSKPVFAKVASVPEAGKTFKIDVESCKNKPAKFVDLRIVQLSAPSSLTAIKTIKLTPRQ